MQVNTKHMDMQDDMLILYMLGEASAEEIKQVEHWRNTDDACNKRFEEFRALWETSKNLANLPEEDTQAALVRFKIKAAARNQINTRTFSLVTVRWLTVAASLLLLIGAVWVFVLRYRVTEVKLITSAETQMASLPDGSVIVLNHRSSFEYPSAFKGNQRSVKLTSGEAFFNIAHDKAKPFLITAGQTLIRVVGTSFNVKNKMGNVEIIVETGIVEVSKNGQMIRLTPGEKTRVAQGATMLEKQRNTDHLYTYYRSKEFEAQDTPLWRVVEVLNEAYDSNIVIEKKELMNLPLNTTFKNESLDKVLDIISRTFNISIERKHGKIILK